MQVDHINIVTTQFTIDLYDAVMSIWRRCEGVGLSDADSREGIERFLRRNDGMSYVAKVDGQVVGVVLAGHDGRRGYLHHLAVHPDYRHQGIGCLLAREALNALRHAGIVKCHGFVFRNNHNAIAFWQSVDWSLREDVCIVSRTLNCIEASGQQTQS